MSTRTLEMIAILRGKNGEVMFSTSDTKEVPDFTEVGKSEFLPSFDELETALIEAAKKVKTAAAEHAINEGSKKKVDEAVARLGSEGLIITASDYGIETKFGPIVGIQYRIVNGRMTIYRSSDDCFPELGSRERLHSSKYDKLFLWNSTKMSFRDTALNLTMWRDQDSGAIIPMTLRNQTDRHGEKITAAISQTAEQALSKAGFNNDVKQLTQEERSDWLKSCALAPDEVIDAAEEAKIKGYNVADYEDPRKVINISADDIGVKAQNPKRPMPHGMEKKKRVDTTVVHFQSNAGQYTLAGRGISATLRVMIGFLAFNDLLHRHPIVFFTDGARVIHNEIERMFGFVSYKLVLDWYHLMKKFAEGFSMAFRGKEIRNAQLNLIEKLLWFGKVDQAISFLRDVDPSLVKSRVQLEQLIDYLNRVRQYIPNYALRGKLGLCNSSNRVEKANDLVVAKRQKHNGTSWSQHGSIGMASVTCACRNGELDNWVKNRKMQFTPIPQLDEAA